ncbi:MAG TPA: xanthine dehydrogenase family protein subunit M [Candidatus Dormibacteraeota bacterium]|nr:xanthine dehydrogenase family protein subunit M [Candidatus Dormibacteraeota bacterium]
MPAEPPIDAPRSLADAFALLAAAARAGGGGVPSPADPPPLTPLAGGTDVMVRITGEIGEPPVRLLDLWRLDELRGIASDGESITLGALTTYTDIRRSPACREHLPTLVEAAATIGAAQIQNRGTLGGNIANASPAGDTLPVLLALDAEIDVGGSRGERTIPASEFWVAYRRTALAPDELILRVRIPVAGGREARFRKIGTRRAQAISKVVMALAWRDREGVSGRAWSDVRLALGSVADRPIRAGTTESLLEGRTPTPETADAAAASLAAEITPIDDVRSTADYRRAVAARVLHRLIRDAGGW